MPRFTHIVATIALIVSLAAVPGIAHARGSGGPASAHRGCNTVEGIPLDDGQSVVVDGVTLTCNNGTVCRISKTSAYCYLWVQASAAQVSNPGGSTPGKRLPINRFAALRRR